MNKEAIIVHESDAVGIGSTIFRGLHRLYYRKPNEVLYFEFTNPLYSNSKNVWSNYLHQPFEHEKDFLLESYNSNKCNTERGVFNDTNNPLLFGYGKAQNNGNDFSNIYKVQEFRTFAKPFLKFKPSLLEKANKFYGFYFNQHKVLSIHKRGTDQFTSRGHAGKSAHLFTLDSVLDIIAKHEKSYDKIFVATDEETFVAKLYSIYSSKIIAYSTIRAAANEDFGIHFKHSNSQADIKYKLGEEALIDAILMSRSNYALYMRSNLSLLSILLRDNFNYEFIDNHIDYGDMG